MLNRDVQKVVTVDSGIERVDLVQGLSLYSSGFPVILRKPLGDSGFELVP